MAKWGISGVTALSEDDKTRNAKITINNNTIEKISKEDFDGSVQVKVEFEKAVITPGLINSHDHLIGNYFPKVGNGPYENWLPWDNDLKSAPVYRERQQIENRDLYLLAGYRNLISGVTSVHDHIPHFVQDPFLNIMPLRVISNFTMAHSIGALALAWGDPVEEYEKSKKNHIPFVTHIAEGFDNETKQNIKTLDKMGALGEYSVLVHGLAFSDDDMKLIKERGASVVWCADSNMFMFNTTARIKKLLETGVNVCIGTDSPMSGGENILSEMKFGKEYYRKTYKEELPDEQIFRMVTINPAKAFKLERTGKIRPGYMADMVVFADNKETPYKSVVSAELKDVIFVAIDGKPVYADKKYNYAFDALKIKYQDVRIDGVDKIVIGDLLGVLTRINKAVGFKKEFPFIPIEY